MAVLETQRTHKMTIELPESIYRLLAQIADASHQSVESIAINVAISLPDLVSHSLAVLSSLPVRTCLPSGEKATELT